MRSIPATMIPARSIGRWASALACALAAGAASAEAASPAQRDGRSPADHGACEQRSASTDPAACRQEAGAALQAQRQGDLTGAQQPLERNALARCGALPAAEQEACHARLQGQGRVSGSVRSGGILREHREVVQVPAGTPAEAAASSAGAAASRAAAGQGGR